MSIFLKDITYCDTCIVFDLVQITDLKIGAIIPRPHTNPFGRQVEEKSLKGVELHVKDAKLVKINPNTYSRDRGSLLTSIYAIRIKM